jgi:hypothetical protein
MKTRMTSLALIMVLLLLAPLSVTSAKNTSEGLSVPISGTFTDSLGGVGKFSGVLTISRFAVVNRGIQAVGSVTGTLTDSQGTIISTGFQTVSLPVTAGNGPIAETPASSESQSEGSTTFMKASFDPSTQRAYLAKSRVAPVPAPQLSCSILRLSIGAIDLNLLGLTVHLNPVLLIIDAVAGPGNLLGNLLCAIVNLLNGGGPLNGIVALLNQLLALLGG